MAIDPELLEGLRDTRFACVEHLESCPSTQDLAAEGPDACVIWADRQTAGRGRQQRSWSSGGAVDVEVSFGIPTGGLSDPALVPVVIPAAVVLALESCSGAKLQLKWPNDVLTDGRKLAGLLIDAHGSKAERLVVGIGVNVGRVEFDEGLPAASFRTAGYADISRSAVVTALGRELDRAVGLLESQDPEAALEASLGGLGSVFVDRLGLVGQSARIELIDGRALTAEVSDLDPRTCWLSDGTAIPLAEIERARVE
ncbi:MAG: biotin--[acetyl-CoA-carboxylase] ligase [Planctomycetota bacterium]